MYIYICICIYIYVHIDIYIHMYLFIHVSPDTVDTRTSQRQWPGLLRLYDAAAPHRPRLACCNFRSTQGAQYGLIKEYGLNYTYIYIERDP